MPEFLATPHTDDRAFTALLEQARPRLAALAARLCVDGGDPDDVLQAALERAWRYRGRCRMDHNPGAWLAQVVFRTYLDHRQQARRIPGTPDDPATIPAPTAPCQLELRDEVSHALASLTPIERSLILGFHRDGRTLAELAAHHDVPVNTVKSHLHRARRKLTGGSP